jgi:4,5-DOPA dioxygenase extradiol
MAPSLFVSHGAPTFALEPGTLGPRLTQFGAQQQDVRAVAVISAHWQSRAVQVMTAPAPATVHDFGGFPAALYELQYPAPGAPELALQAGQLLSAAGFSVTSAPDRGLDHGAWVPLRFLWPKADMPVFQVSMPFDLDAAAAWRMGEALAPLRSRGIMVLGTGSLTHNLSEFRAGVQQPAAYAVEFTRWIRDVVERADRDSMLKYRELAPHARRAHPTEEHFLPLVVAMGASSGADRVEILEGGILYGMLSMDGFAWGGA